MAERKKRTRVQAKKRATVRGKARKSSASLRRKATKGAAPAAETVIVDVIEGPVPGVVTVTEFEQTEGST